MGTAAVFALSFLKNHFMAIALSIALAIGVGLVHHHGYKSGEANWRPKYEQIVEQRELARKMVTEFALQLTAANAKIDELTRAALKRVHEEFDGIKKQVAAAAGGRGIAVPAGVFNGLELGRQAANAAGTDAGGANGTAAAPVVADAGGQGATEEVDPVALVQWQEAYATCVKLWSSVRDKYNAARDGQIKLEGK